MLANTTNPLSHLIDFRCKDKGNPYLLSLYPLYFMLI